MNKEQTQSGDEARRGLITLHVNKGLVHLLLPLINIKNKGLGHLQDSEYVLLKDTPAVWRRVCLKVDCQSSRRSSAGTRKGQMVVLSLPETEDSLLGKSSPALSLSAWSSNTHHLHCSHTC